MKQIIFSALVLLFTPQIFAQDLAGALGVRANSATAEEVGSSIEGKTGLSAGMLAIFPMTDLLHVRTGLFAATRDFTVKAGALSSDAKFTYFEIPVGVLFKFNDFGGIFLGTALNLNFSKSCDGTCEEIGNPLAAQAGVSIRTASNFGFEFYGEMLMSKVAKGIKDAKGMGVNVTYYFE